jgi:hypothetical protein
MAEYVKSLKEEYKISGTINSKAFAEAVGVSQDELCYIYTQLFWRKSMEMARLNDKYCHCLREKEYIEKALDEDCKNNVEKQQRLIKAGLPIAKKSSRLSYIRLLMKLGSTDEELMEFCGISRTTLWRYKKEIKEREEHGIL